MSTAVSKLEPAALCISNFFLRRFAFSPLYVGLLHTPAAAGQKRLELYHELPDKSATTNGTYPNYVAYTYNTHTHIHMQRHKTYPEREAHKMELLSIKMATTIAPYSYRVWPSSPFPFRIQPNFHPVTREKNATWGSPNV